MTALTVSLALCTYNGEKFLLEQLQSFLAQTRQPNELVVCDDVSSDRTLEILNEFAQCAPFPVRIFVSDMTLRSTKNFEKAIGLCEGDIIFLSDQDDVWFPDKLARMLTIFEEDAGVGAVFLMERLLACNLKVLATGCGIHFPSLYPSRSDFEVAKL